MARRITLACMLVLITATAGASQTQSLILPAPKPDPFKKLFQVQMPPEPARPVVPATPKRSVVCGLTIIAADHVDPKFVKQAPHPPGTEFTLKTQVPPVCAAPEARR